jgi:phenylacetate-CoA ligase
LANWFEKSYWNTYTVLESRGDRQLPFRPLDEVLALQRRRLCALVAHAYHHVPFYARSMREAGLLPEDIRTASDLEKLPIIDAEQLSQDPRQFQSVPLNPRRCVRVYSSGTSGKPKEIYHDASSLFMHMAHQQRKHAAAAHFLGRRHGYREMNALPPCAVNFQLRDFYRDFCWIPAGMDMCRGMLPVNTSFAENLRAIDEFRPDLIKGLGSYIGALFRWAWSRKQKFSLPKLILYGADHMPDADRALIEGEFGIPVLSSYQAVEAMHIAFQCEQRQGFHLNLDLVAVRTVDAAGRTLPPGQSGDIVISNLTNRATVLLNYRLGDRV